MQNFKSLKTSKLKMVEDAIGPMTSILMEINPVNELGN
jgi:hypothetical protein